jgi:LysR family transcriptional regulator, low CO2-responsive transcriptional regulator
MTNDPRRGRREGAISLNALRCFAAVVEGGSISRAAEILGLSQPTISVTLKGLERACGTLLLHRRPRLALTDAGQDLLARARLVLGRMDELEETMRQSRDLRRGSITIGLSTPAHAMPCIAALMAAYPELRVRTRLGNTNGLLEALAACEIEVAIMTLTRPVEGMSCTLLVTQRLIACVPASAPRAGISLEQLAEGPLVLREPGSMTRAMMEAAFVAQGLSGRIALEVGSREAAREAVAAGIGISVVLDGEAWLDQRLLAVPILGEPILGGVYAVALPESLDLPAVRAFVGVSAEGVRQAAG